jgi:hypothetical protein
MYVLHRFLETFQKHFYDCDIFVGVNPISLEDVESIIQSYGLNIKSIDRCPIELYSDIDASAYQIALKKLSESGTEYENYWFVHTKSGVNEHSNYLREWYIENFLSNRQSIESFINNTSGIGSYAMLGLEYDDAREFGETDCDIDIFKNTLTNDLPYTHAYFFYIHTLYVINKKPMQIFLKLISNKWFETKLDRYYFEGVFPFIVSRSGYFPYIENRYTCNGVDLYETLTKWITDNGLEKYKKYSNIFKTNYLFHQLTPPYVISNS